MRVAAAEERELGRLLDELPGASETEARVSVSRILAIMAPVAQGESRRWAQQHAADMLQEGLTHLISELHRYRRGEIQLKGERKANGERKAPVGLLTAVVRTGGPKRFTETGQAYVGMTGLVKEVRHSKSARAAVEEWTIAHGHQDFDAQAIRDRYNRGKHVDTKISLAEVRRAIKEYEL
ncbi:hypothetical protein GCM10022288_15910 [Gryllotalpicola kribbensis]|uniref:Uncharacterized protein n=1 Tax=Gryllotalpicola kribbensis TaxID=993084 RepID=A0ABP8ARQ0_9MICO